MKRLLLLSLVLLFSINESYGQCPSVINGSKSSPFTYRSNDLSLQWYLAGSFDINNAFDINETLTEPQGFDYDLELGVRRGAFAYYGFYGEYDKREYTNYGVGFDYYAISGYAVDVSLGGNIGFISKPHRLIVDKLTHFAFAIRTKAIYDLSDTVGVFITAQYQQRPDRTIEGVFEPSLGIQIYL